MNCRKFAQRSDQSFISMGCFLRSKISRFFLKSAITLREIFNSQIGYRARQPNEAEYYVKIDGATESYPDHIWHIQREMMIYDMYSIT